MTEPNAGLNTAEITTRAERRGDRYVVNGTKIWTSTAQVGEPHPAAHPHHAAASR